MKRIGYLIPSFALTVTVDSWTARANSVSARPIRDTFRDMQKVGNLVVHTIPSLVLNVSWKVTFKHSTTRTMPKSKSP